MRKDKAETIAYAIRKECQNYSLYDWCERSIEEIAEQLKASEKNE